MIIANADGVHKELNIESNGEFLFNIDSVF